MSYHVVFSQARRFHECRRAEGVLAVLELARAQALFARRANAAWKQVWVVDVNMRQDIYASFSDDVFSPDTAILSDSSVCVCVCFFTFQSSQHFVVHARTPIRFFPFAVDADLFLIGVLPRCVFSQVRASSLHVQ